MPSVHEDAHGERACSLHCRACFTRTLPGLVVLLYRRDETGSVTFGTYSWALTCFETVSPNAIANAGQTREYRTIGF